MNHSLWQTFNKTFQARLSEQVFNIKMKFNFKFATEIYPKELTFNKYVTSNDDNTFLDLDIKVMHYALQFMIKETLVFSYSYFRFWMGTCLWPLLFGFYISLGRFACVCT